MPDEKTILDAALNGAYPIGDNGIIVLPLAFVVASSGFGTYEWAKVDTSVALFSFATNGGILAGSTTDTEVTVLVLSAFTDAGPPIISIGGKGMLSWVIVFSAADFSGELAVRNAVTNHKYMEINLIQDK